MMETVLIHMSYQKCYDFNGVYFEFHRNKPFPPWPLKKDGEPKKLAGDGFYKKIEDFLCMDKTEQEKYRVF